MVVLVAAARVVLMVLVQPSVFYSIWVGENI